MPDNANTKAEENSDPDVPLSRLELLWDVIVFQAKLTVDGLRDVVLVPISLLSALLGLLIGGDQPAQYFNRVLRFGRKTEYWINLFGHRRTAGTSDEIIKPIQERVFEEASNRPWLRKAGGKLNKSIDTVSGAISPQQADSDDEKP